MARNLTVLTIVGPWQGEATTGLMQRCRDSWQTPLHALSDLMVATFLIQRVAEIQMIEEAEARLEKEERDETEYYDGQASEALADARQRNLMN